MPGLGSDEWTYEEYVQCPNAKPGMSIGPKVGLAGQTPGPRDSWPGQQGRRNLMGVAAPLCGLPSGAPVLSGQAAPLCCPARERLA